MAKIETLEPGQPHFHYDRAEFLAKTRGLSAEDSACRSGRRGFLRGNRSLAFLLADLVLLLIMGFIVYSVIGLRWNTEEVGGRRYVLTAFASQGDVFASVRVTALQDSEAARAQINVSAGGGSRIETRRMMDLPIAGGQEFVERFRLPPGSRAPVLATVRVGGREFELRAPVDFD